MLLEAQDPKTPPERLSNLAKDPSPDIRRAVAKNPNTPLPALLDVAKEFPEEFWQNPALPLLLLEDPGFFEEKFWGDLKQDMRQPKSAKRSPTTPRPQRSS